MDVTLKPELQRFVDEQVEAGRFTTPAEVLEAALLRLMRDPLDDELDAADVAAIEQSEQEIARGEDMDWDEVSARLRQKYLAE
jgi:putative addiction module CopG family antidote